SPFRAKAGSRARTTPGTAADPLLQKMKPARDAGAETFRIGGANDLASGLASKKCPSMASGPAGERSADIAETKLTPAYWLHRVYRNSFTYRGTRRFVRGWSVKIQVHGQRRTFKLKAIDRGEAAVEAHGIYMRILRDGWATFQPAWISGRAPHGSTASGPPRETVRAGRPVQRKYTTGLTPGLEQ